MRVQRLSHQIPTLFPSSQEVRDDGQMLLRLLVVRPVVALQPTLLINSLQHSLHILHSIGSIHQHDAVTMLQRQFRHALNVVSRQQVVIQRILLTIQILVFHQLILSRALVVFHIAREVVGDEVFIPRKCTRLDVSVIQRRVPKPLVDFLKAQRSLTFQQVDDV